MAFKSWPFCFVKSVSFHWFSSHMVWDGEWGPSKTIALSSLKNPKLHQREDNSNWQGLLNFHFEGKAILQFRTNFFCAPCCVRSETSSNLQIFHPWDVEKDKQKPASFGRCFWWNFKAGEQKMPSLVFWKFLLDIYFCPICFWVLFGTIFAAFFFVVDLSLLVRLDESLGIFDGSRDFGWAWDKA